MTAEDIFMTPEYPHSESLYKNKRVLSLLQEICSTKQFGDDCFYRYEQSKCLQWLTKRLSKTINGTFISFYSLALKQYAEVHLTEEEFQREALRLLSACVSPSLFEALCTHVKYGFSMHIK